MRFYYFNEHDKKWKFEKFNEELYNQNGIIYKTCYLKSVAKDLAITIHAVEKQTKMNYFYFPVISDAVNKPALNMEREHIDLSVECRDIQIIDEQYAFLALKDGSWILWNVLNKSIDSKFQNSNKLKKGGLKSYNIVKYPYQAVLTKSNNFLVILQYDILYLFELNWEVQSALFVDLLILTLGTKPKHKVFKKMENKYSIRSALFLDSSADKIKVNYETMTFEFFLSSSGFEEVLKKETNSIGNSVLAGEGLFRRNGRGFRGEFIDVEGLPSMYFFVDMKQGMMNLLVNKNET